MPSGKRARQQRQAAAATAGRTPPPVRSKGAGGTRARQASPRTLGIAGGVVLVIIIAIVLAVVLGSGGGSSNTAPSDLPKIGDPTWAGAEQGAVEANDLFKGIPQKGLVLGKPSAPVEMEMFIDAQCPICRDYEVNSLPTIVQKYIRNGRVQLHLQPWAFIGDQSKTGRLAIIAASFQNKGYEYTKVLYNNQGEENSGWLTDAAMGQIAASVKGLKVQQVLTQKDESAAATIASKVDDLAKKANVQGTPTILIGPTGGKLQDIMPPGYAPTLQITQQSLDQALANAGA
jgi:protein-disulfide isomerase